MAADPLPVRPPPGCACPDCGAPVDRNFCPECGQVRARDLRLPIRSLAAEAVQETVGVESRLAGTFSRPSSAWRWRGWASPRCSRGERRR